MTCYNVTCRLPSSDESLVEIATMIDDIVICENNMSVCNKHASAIAPYRGNGRINATDPTKLAFNPI